MMAEAKEPRSAPPKELPAETTQASRFGKTRTAQSTALLEDYVELIADLLATHGEARPTDVARRLGVSHATAIKTIARLKREGLATAKPYRGVFLTPEGDELARRVRARHRLVVDLLVAVGVPPEAAPGQTETNLVRKKVTVRRPELCFFRNEQFGPPAGILSPRSPSESPAASSPSGPSSPIHPTRKPSGFGGANPRRRLWFVLGWRAY